MKDYSMNLEERKKFILGYKIKNGLMKVKYALGFKDNIQHNEENEKIVLDKMKEQVTKVDSEKFIKKEKDDINIFFTFGSVCTIASILLFCLKISPGLEVFAYICRYMFALGGIILIPKGFISLSKLQDYKKNKRFVEVEEKINGNVRKHENILVNVSAKTKNMVKETPEDKPVFNINSFNYVPNRDLEQIMENISRDEFFKYKYEETTTVQEDKPKTRRKIKTEKIRD